ncbi:ATP-binding protein [Candidatus Woesearchaeota archaeon]|nr:ATP-binding protein [Candidatus Woesearchaeota archaeon]
MPTTKALAVKAKDKAIEDLIYFDNVGGCRKAKEELKKLSLFIKNPEISSLYGANPPRGILLYGSPGNGKTLLAKALANECDAYFMDVKCSDIGSMWVNETANNLRDKFETAKRMTKRSGTCIMYFDEFDSIAASRQIRYDTREDNKVVATLNTYLDGLKSRENIYVVASTNLLKILDSAIVRPGRFDIIIKVPPPDYNDKIEIFKIHLNNFRKKSIKKPFSKNINYAILAKESEGFSGSDIAEVVRRSCWQKTCNAYDALVKNNLSVEELVSNSSSIIMQDILDQLEMYKLERKKQERTVGFGELLKKNKQQKSEE